MTVAEDHRARRLVKILQKVVAPPWKRLALMQSPGPRFKLRLRRGQDMLHLDLHARKFQRAREWQMQAGAIHVAANRVDGRDFLQLIQNIGRVNVARMKDDLRSRQNLAGGAGQNIRACQKPRRSSWIALQVSAARQASWARAKSFLLSRLFFGLRTRLADHLFDSRLGGVALRIHFAAVGQAQLASTGTGRGVQPEYDRISLLRGNACNAGSVIEVRFEGTNSRPGFRQSADGGWRGAGLKSGWQGIQKPNQQCQQSHRHRDDGDRAARRAAIRRWWDWLTHLWLS